MGDGWDLTVATGDAWTVFRRRLADRLAAMGDDEVIHLEFESADRCEGLMGHLVTASTEDGRGITMGALGDVSQWPALVALGWRRVVDDEGIGLHELVGQPRDADRLAVLAVDTLRDVYGVPHPAFVLDDGLGLIEPVETVETVAPVVRSEPATARPHDEDEPADQVAFALGPDHLQELVDAAMMEVFPDLKHDADGDIPIIAGRSLAFVRVLSERPFVELYAEIALDVVDRDRATLEVGLLNKSHPTWKFVAVDDMVVMRHELMAAPFSASQLRGVAHRFVDEVDSIAEDLVARVGGRRFRDAPAVPAARAADVAKEDGLAMTGLLELFHLGTPRASTVAGLFAHDRVEIIRQIVRIRTCGQDCGGHDPEVVLTSLRQALRIASDGVPRSTPLAPRPRSVQPSLLSDGETGEDTLDLGWPA